MDRQTLGGDPLWRRKEGECRGKNGGKERADGKNGRRKEEREGRDGKGEMRGGNVAHNK